MANKRSIPLKDQKVSSKMTFMGVGSQNFARSSKILRKVYKKLKIHLE